MGERIKDTYQKHLWLFVAANIVIFWVISINGVFDIELANIKMAALLTPKSLLFTLSPIIVLILNGLISNPIKEFLVFWKIKDRLPGCRSFTVLAKTDHRIDIASLENNFGKLPSSPNEQNKLWYKIYKTMSDNELIKGSHKDFLLTRDLCSLSFLFALIIIPVIFFLLESISIKYTYASFLIVQYIVISISSRNFGNRFACNVLANV